MNTWLRLTQARHSRYEVPPGAQAERVAAAFAAKSVGLPERTAFARWLVEQGRMGEGPTRRERGERDD